MADETVLIKKYSNRRLYNTSESAYMTLDQLAEIIQSGKNVQVVEASSGDDVTAYILTQVLVEEAKKKKFLLPVRLLHLMLRYDDNMMGDFFDIHLSQTIDSYVKQRKSFDDQFKQVLHFSTEFTEMARRSVDDLAKAAPFPFFRPGDKEPGKDEGS
ncbi:polyhydroxyalkanoate synthesis regulator DNA-binding domain-containing protein [Desulfoluna sp.]|uniref:polyhydroxyalkanoate synthesis regulator DNA-binding domain-containing protein n=1 Tax=Desulfoluna sp. TaxID=2045199 RepID=UPI002629859E|nr:polyhydroxyalkanoate synthesis regulator DNA-binding domain-containing protein [Desulfoluna sp.]